ncbi:transcriptional regulator [Epilithonimonas sp. UC225_85]|uniref:transcriptional regulator n=1 Tax=Epilithonimonas sp. UC225_85 TaxID=3350167 RepID=UPI0036D36CD7
MIELKKKYLEKRLDDPPALGNFINWHFKQNNTRKKEISTFLDILPTTLNQYFKQPSFQFGILWRISQAANHNFLMQLGERLGIDYQTKKEKELLELLQEKDAEINSLKTQLGVYKQIHKIES